MDLKKIKQFCLLDRDSLFNTKHLENFSNRLGNKDKDPFIGYFGKEYEKQKIKVMFLARSNAESSKSHKTLDENINSAFQTFKNSNINLEINYRNYANRYVEAMPKWMIYKTFVQYFLNKSELDIHKISYANAVPFRYKGKPLIPVFEIAYRNFTNELISILQPNIIIPLGTDDHLLVRRFCNHKTIKNITISEGIRRTNGDFYLDELGRELLEHSLMQYQSLKENL